MTKNEYLEELKKELKLNNVADIDEIIAEYAEHFACKIEEGLTEEEVARKLASPKEIAKDYCTNTGEINKFEKATKVTGLTFLSIPLCMIYVLICASVVVLGAFAITSLVAGFCLITTLNIAGLLPSMPYFSALMIGIACLGLSAIASVGTIYLFLYVKQWGKMYAKWVKSVANGYRYTSISKHPKISKKFNSNLKLIAIIGLACFVSALIIGYISMCISAKSFEPWHIWNWFE